MNEIVKTTLLGLFFGTFGTTIGGIIGVLFKKTSNKFLSFVLSFASRTYACNNLFRLNTRGNGDFKDIYCRNRNSIWNNNNDIM